MLKDRKLLEQYIEDKKEKYIFDTMKRNELINYIYEKYNLPVGIAAGMIVQNDLVSQTEFILFCLLEAIGTFDKKNYVEKFFTPIEIQGYLNEKWTEENIQFPIEFSAIKVNDDQWIGITNTKVLLQLRKAQLIKYNANAQRVLKKIVRGENVIFKIKPNVIAIKAIKALMKSRLYIPTTITLNIPFESDSIFSYDDKNKKFIVDKLDTFDISDGYHRYLALCELCDEDDDFFYQMELRITNFTEDKVRNFIFQEDQKTRMTRSQSNSMNTNRVSNMAVDRLNEMSSFYFKGQIGRNSGTIDYAAFSDIIEEVYFKAKKLYTNADVLNVVNDLKEKFNALAEFNSSYMNMIMGKKELLLIMYFFKNEESIETAIKLIDSAFKNNKTEEFGLISNNVGTMFKHIKKFL